MCTVTVLCLRGGDGVGVEVNFAMLPRLALKLIIFLTLSFTMFPRITLKLTIFLLLSLQLQ